MASALLLVAVIACYWNGLGAPFLFDDTGAVLNNPTIRHLGSAAVLNPPSDGSTTTGRPIVNLSFAVNYAMGGESVWSYRALNLMIHALAALTLMGIVRRTLSGPVLSGRFGAAAPGLALLVALLWALHPIQTESVVCIAQRTESLCGLFYLLALFCFICAAQAAEAPARRGWFTLSVVWCFAGMGTKEVMVTAPLMVWLYDRTFVAGSFASALRLRRGFYAALASTWLLLGWLVLRGGRGVAAGFGLGVSWWSYLLQQCEAIVLYLKLSAWPHPLVLDYGTVVAQSVADVWWQGIGVMALLGATIWALERKPILGFAGAWFFVILAPSSSVVPLVTQTMAEHRMYLPLAGILALVVLIVYEWGGWQTAKWLAVLALFFGILTVLRNHDYRDAVTIWSDTVDKRPSNERAHNNLAWALQQQGRVGEANQHFARAVELRPDYVSARYNWGVALLDQGHVEQAIAQFEAAVRLAPGHADALVNLGNALMQVQRAAEAVPQYEAALKIRPGADVHYDLGVALIALDRPDEAAAHLRTALEMNPALPEAHYQLARGAEQTGQFAEAERQYAETLRLAPDHLAAHRNLGLLLARSEQLAPAAEQFRAVIRLAPADVDAHANLGNVYLLQGQAREAVRCYEEALRLRPDDDSLRENLRQARESLR